MSGPTPPWLEETLLPKEGCAPQSGWRVCGPLLWSRGPIWKNALPKHVQVPVDKLTIIPLDTPTVVDG